MPIIKDNTEIAMRALSFLLVVWVVINGVPVAPMLFASAIGAPHFGHAEAVSDTCVLHSGQSINAIVWPFLI